MKTLDRYIIRQFLLNFLILTVVLMVLFIVIDLVVDLDEFIEAASGRSGRFGGFVPALLWTMADYYGPVMVLMYVFFSGLLVVGAMGFTLAGLSRSGELVAMLTGGVSMYRIAAPLLVAGCALNLLTLPCQELLIPRFADKLARSKSQVKHDTLASFRVTYASDSRGALLSAGEFSHSDARPTMTNVTVLVRSPEGRTLRRVTAPRAEWDQARGGWRLFDPQTFTRTPAPGEGPLPAAGSAEPDFFATDLSPKVLIARRASIYPRLLSSPELRSLADSKMLDPGQMWHIMLSRYSLMVTNVLILAMGLRFFLLREPTTLLVQGVKAAAVCVGAWGTALVLLQMGQTQFNPVLAAWLPAILYFPVMIAMTSDIKT